MELEQKDIVMEMLMLVLLERIDLMEKESTIGVMEIIIKEIFQMV